MSVKKVQNNLKMTSNMETPVQRLGCSEPECNKTFVNIRNKSKHMDKFHMMVNAVSKSPIVNTVRTLFSGDNSKDISTPSTQGASDGSVNSPKVISTGFFQCNECTYEFTIKEELLKHKVEKHDNASAAESGGNDTSLDEGELVQLMEMDDITAAKELAEKEAVEKIVNSFVESAFRVMNPGEETDIVSCHNCDLKDEVIVDKDSMIDAKETVVAEKNAAINGLMQRLKKLEEERTLLKKRVEQTEKLKETVSTRNKEISNLKVQICTKDQLLALAKNTTDTVNVDIQLNPEAVVKKCKKCTFTAPNMDVLGLHMENDHQYQFDCNECGKKFPFKNQLKLHRREIHEEGTFACFVCNEKFKIHKQLKAHIQRKCKSQSMSAPKAPNPIVHKHNEDILPEDEHKCPKCPKITNNQVSLLNHMNTVHQATIDKCDTCGQEFTNREILVKHIVDNHTNIGIQQGGWKKVQYYEKRGQQQQHGQWLPKHKCQQCQYETNSQNELEFHIETLHHNGNARNWCHRCNIEVNRENTRERHICRMPDFDTENTCNFCKAEVISTEAKQNHVCEQHPFKTVSQQNREKRRPHIECNNGIECWRAKLGKCWFKHSNIVNVLPHQEQRQMVEARTNSARPPLYCKYQDQCFKGQQLCRFKHINQDFLQSNQSQTKY